MKSVARNALAALLLMSFSTAAVFAQAPSEAELEARLESARQALEAAAKEIAELSGRASMAALHDRGQHHVIRKFDDGDRSARLGISISQQIKMSDDGDSDSTGVVVMGVTPDGPADEAGLRAGDVLIEIGDRSLTREDGAMGLLEYMAEVEPDSSVPVRYERDGTAVSTSIVAEAHEDHGFAFGFGMGDAFEFDDVEVVVDGDFEFDGDLDAEGLAGVSARLARMFPDGGLHLRRTLRGSDLAPVSAALGDYFGVSGGVLVVEADDASMFDLKDGDVIVAIDGDKVSRPRDVRRSLARAEPGETITLDVVRQRSAVTLEATLPRD